MDTNVYVSEDIKYVQNTSCIEKTDYDIFNEIYGADINTHTHTDTDPHTA